MVTTRIFSNTPLTNEEKYFLQSILTKETFEHEQFFKLLTIDSPVDPALEHIEFRILFDKAILSALLDAKKNLFLFLPNERFSTYQLAESILRDLKNSSIKNELLPIIANDLKNFNKGQSRIFFLHTRKNNASYIDALPKDIKQKNLGSYFKYEKYILEIEYLLKKPNSFGTTIYNIQPIIDVYALNRIRSIKNWENFTLDQLNELRKTYEKLRSFLVYGKQYKKKIPTYCYENYLDCIRLIYDYVKAYTPHQLLDVAYYRLESTYLFYTYIEINYHQKSSYLNAYTVPLENRKLFENLYSQSASILLKLVDFAINYISHPCYSNFDYLIHIFSHYISDLYSEYNEINYDTPFPLLTSANHSPSLDEWLLYNALWNDTMSVSQQEFIYKLESIAQKIHPQYGILQLSLELFGIDIKLCHEEYKQILDKIYCEKKWANPNVIINHVLKLLYQDRCYLSISFFKEKLSRNEPSNISLSKDEQTTFLEIILKNLDTYVYFVAGRPDSHSWEKGIAPNLIYQFIYRNWYGLGMPDIFPNDVSRNHAMIKRFLKKYDLKLTQKIEIEDYPWLQYALENLKNTPEAYQRYIKISTEYNG